MREFLAVGSKRDAQADVFGEGSLAGVEGEEFFCAQVDGGGDVEDVEGAVSIAGGALKRVGASETQNGVGVARHQHVDAGGHVAFPVGNHLVGFVLGVAFGAVAGVEPDLESDGLDEFKFQKFGEVEGFFHGFSV